jgi:hypothetical protein
LKADANSSPPNATEFLAAAGKLTTTFAWPSRTFEQDGEVVLVGLTKTDPSFERFVWVYDTSRTTLRCMLVSKEVVPIRRQAAILELCARVNEGLPFGCLEYSFGDHVLVFRDAADLDWGPLEKVIEGTTARVLNLGRRYAVAIRAALEGEKPKDAVKKVETE